MAIAVKPARVLLWSVAIAGLVVFSASLLLREERISQVAVAPDCLPPPLNIKMLGPALASQQVARITGEPEWEALKAGMRPRDTVHQFETSVTGGHLMLRGNCYLGQTVAWIR